MVPYEWERRSSSSMLMVFDDQGPLFPPDVYGGDEWYRWEATDMGRSYINNTLSVTYTPGSTMKIRFEGTQVVLLGALPFCNKSYPSATYSIDDGSPGESDPWVDSSGDIIYFGSPLLSSTNHTLYVTVTEASRDAPFYFDALLVKPVDGQDMAGMVLTQTVVVTATATTTTLPSYTKSNRTPVAAIVGGAVGGAMLLLVVLSMLLFLRQKKRSQPYYFDRPEILRAESGGPMSRQPSIPSSTIINPFPAPPSMQQLPYAY